MFLPIGDTPNPRGFTAWVNWALIAANVAVYVLITMPLSAQAPSPVDPLLREYLDVMLRAIGPAVSPRELLASVSAYDLFVFEHGYKPGAPEITDLLWAMFLHGGFAHLAGNMLFLWIYGDNVEHRLGRAGYLLSYLGTGAVATWSFAAFAEGSMVPLVGASGAISGVLGLYFWLFPRNKVKLLVFLFPFFMDVLLISARWLLAAYVILDNVLPMVLGAQSSVAYGAHLGGFAGGLGVALVGQRAGWRWPWRRALPRAAATHPAAGDPAAEGEDGLEALVWALEREDRRAALELLTSLDWSQVSALDADDLAVLAGWLADAGHAGPAHSLLRRGLNATYRRSEAARLHLAIARLHLREGQPATAYQHLSAAAELDPRSDTAHAALKEMQRLLERRRKR